MFSSKQMVSKDFWMLNCVDPQSSGKVVAVRRAGVIGRSRVWSAEERSSCCQKGAAGRGQQVLCASARKGKLCVFSKSGICVFEKTLHVFEKLCMFSKKLCMFFRCIFAYARQIGWRTARAQLLSESEAAIIRSEALAAYVAYSNSHRSCCHIVCYLLASCILSRAGQRKNICAACTNDNRGTQCPMARRTHESNGTSSITTLHKERMLKLSLIRCSNLTIPKQVLDTLGSWQHNSRVTEASLNSIHLDLSTHPHVLTNHEQLRASL